MQAAINASAPGDVVTVSNGVYLLQATVWLTNQVTLRGFGPRGSVALDGQGAVRCLDLCNATVDNITMTNGFDSGSYYGGALHSLSGLVANCIMTHCRAYGSTFSRVAGLSAEHSTFTNCDIVACTWMTVHANVAGLYARDCTLVNCRFVTNVSLDTFSALYARDGCMVRDCSFSNNVGHITASFYYASVSNCLFENNKGQVTVNYGSLAGCAIRGNRNDSYNVLEIGDGGMAERCRIEENQGRVELLQGGILRSSLVSANRINTPYQSDAVVYVWNGGRIENCTIVGNTNSPSEAGGVRISGTLDPEDSVLMNSIVYGNSGTEISNSASSIIAFNCIEGWTDLSNGNITNNPCLAGPTGFHLATNSPCLNAGTNLPWTTTGWDCDLQPRNLEERVDIGWDEYFGGIFMALAGDAGAMTNSWRAVSNAVYQLQGRENLVEGNWEAVGDPVTGRTASVSVKDLPGAWTTRYYRVELKSWR
ncbi:MAG TPA: hypothetical protein DCZ95_18345 [Verrucomicrobia bacterium]|nr:MAG: hypothetical protein A2X46_16490 [Lentisphaerae bacterium GWF2_57_35]HBA86050.1 hypothetical protein [Verrucomicrobiota bacterium]